MKLYLKEPTIEDKEEVIKMCKEFEDSNDEYKFEGTSNIKYVLNDSYEKYIGKCEADKNIESVNPNWSNANNYLLVDENNHIYGCSQFRHHILGDLINVGGNFAYAIRPSERGKGYGTIQLKLLLEKAEELGLEKVLVTCRENNIGSKKTMKKFIGKTDTLVPSIHDGIMEYRYWINISKNIKGNSKNVNDRLKNMYLKFPTKDDKNEYIKYQKEEHNIDLNYEQWLDGKIKSSNQVGNIDGKVPRTILLLTDGQEIFGQVSIRYNIDEGKLKKYIGHIGYEIRKKYRNNGYGNLILNLAIEKCYELGLKEIMVSCKVDNIASAKVIENNGGIFSHKIYIEEEKSEFNIYWIEKKKEGK